jgi:hypothetical protein
VDAMDSKGMWYSGIIADENLDPKSKEMIKKVHFFKFESKWDEWYGNDNIEKMAPFKSHCADHEE